MMSTESQPLQSTIYDERIFNDRIRQLFDSVDSPSLLSPEKNISQMTSIVDALFPEQIPLHQQRVQDLREQRRSSTNDLTTVADRFPVWKNSSGSSASAFCGGTSNNSSGFANRRQSALNSSTRSLRNTYHQPQTSGNYRPPPVTRPRFGASSIRLPPAAVINASNTNLSNGLARSSSSLSTGTGGASAPTDYQPRFASRVSATRLPTTGTAPVGSHDQIAANVDPIAPSTNAVLSRNTSTSSTSANAQSQQFVTMTQTTTTTFCYVPATGSLAYQNLTGTGRSTTARHH